MDALVARPVGDAGVALQSGGVGTRAQQSRPCRQGLATQSAELVNRFLGVPANTRDQLQLARVDLRCDATPNLGRQLREHRFRRIDLTTRHRVDEKALLLDPKAERLALPKRRFQHGRPACHLFRRIRKLHVPPIPGAGTRQATSRPEGRRPSRHLVGRARSTKSEPCCRGPNTRPGSSGVGRRAPLLSSAGFRNARQEADNEH